VRRRSKGYDSVVAAAPARPPEMKYLSDGGRVRKGESRAVVKCRYVRNWAAP